MVGGGGGGCDWWCGVDIYGVGFSRGLMRGWGGRFGEFGGAVGWVGVFQGPAMCSLLTATLLVQDLRRDERLIPR